MSPGRRAGGTDGPLGDRPHGPDHHLASGEPDQLHGHAGAGLDAVGDRRRRQDAVGPRPDGVRAGLRRGERPRPLGAPSRRPQGVRARAHRAESADGRVLHVPRGDVPAGRRAPRPLSDLARRALAVNQAMLALGHEVFDADGARFVRDRRLPEIWEANRISTVTAATPEAIDCLLARAEREYAGFGHRRFDLDVTTPPGVEARLLLDGYRGREFLVMVLEREGTSRAVAADIRPCADETAWAAYGALKREDWRESAQRLGLSEGEVGGQMVDGHRRRCPPARYWLAWVDGAPRGFISSWEGTDGVGQIEDLFVHPECRGRGLAAALIRHGVAECRRAGAGDVVIVADADDTPRLAYARMGFRPVAVTRAYLRIVARP